MSIIYNANLHNYKEVREMRILIADGNKSSRDRLKKILSKAGHEVFIASDGVEAFHAYEDNGIDIAFIGWTIPKMNGTELCLRIRDYNLKTSHVSYLILVSAKSEKHDMVDGLDAGVDDFVIKPYSESVIISRVRVAERVLETKYNKIPKVKPIKDKEIEPVAILNEEHRLIHKITGILEVAANMLSEGTPLPKKFLEWGTSSAFVLNWQLHEEKELFYIDLFVHRAQEIHGKTAQLYSRSSLIQIMREHKLIKKMILEMQSAAKSYNIDNRKSVLNLRDLMLRYIPVVRFHAAREEDVFLPFSQRYLIEEDISRIMKDFKRVEDEVGLEAIKERMDIVDKLQLALKIKEKDI